MNDYDDQMHTIHSHAQFLPYVICKLYMFERSVNNALGHALSKVNVYTSPENT